MRVWDIYGALRFEQCDKLNSKLGVLVASLSSEIVRQQSDSAKVLEYKRRITVLKKQVKSMRLCYHMKNVNLDVHWRMSSRWFWILRLKDRKQ